MVKLNFPVFKDEDIFGKCSLAELIIPHQVDNDVQTKSWEI